MLLKGWGGWEHCSQLPPAPHSLLSSLEEEEEAALGLEDVVPVLSTRELGGSGCPEIPSRPGSGEARGCPDPTTLDSGFPTHCPDLGVRGAAKNVVRSQENPMGPILAFALPLSVFYSPSPMQPGNLQIQ